MADKSKIEWTDATWNTVYGCTRVSAGCDNCYAVRQTQRLAGTLPAAQDLVNPGKRHFNGRVRLLEDRLDVPPRWKTPKMIFVNSLSDLFHPEVPFEFVDKVFAVMALCPQHTFQVLTKRPERMWEYMAFSGRVGRTNEVVRKILKERGDPRWNRDHGFPWTPTALPNVWLGTSVENQEAANERIPHLLQAPAAVRFLSCEPLLGPVDLMPWLEIARLADTGEVVKSMFRPELGWIIAGGESGPKARPCNVAWIRSIVGQCREAGVPVFVKQLGARPVYTVPFPCEKWPDSEMEYAMELTSRKGSDPSEWPEDLRVQEWPQATRAGLDEGES